MANWDIIDEKTIGDIRFTIHMHQIRNQEGRIFPYSYVQVKNGVMIIPFLDEDNIVLIKQYRHALKQEIYEFPAGGVELNEDKQAAALRELQEETGYYASSMIYIGEFLASPGLSTERVYVYAAIGLSKGDNALEDGEEISLKLVNRAEFENMVLTDSFNTAVGIAAYYKFRCLFNKTNKAENT